MRISFPEGNVQNYWCRVNVLSQRHIHQGRIRRQPGHMIQTKTRSHAPYSLNHGKRKTSRVRGAKVSAAISEWEIKFKKKTSKYWRLQWGSAGNRGCTSQTYTSQERWERGVTDMGLYLKEREREKRMPNLQRRRLAFLHSWDNLPLFSPSHFSAEPWQLLRCPLGRQV